MAVSPCTSRSGVDLDQIGAHHVDVLRGDLGDRVEELSGRPTPRLEVRHPRREGRVEHVDVDRDVDGPAERRDDGVDVARLEHLDTEAVGLLALMRGHRADAHLDQAGRPGPPP